MKRTLLFHSALVAMLVSGCAYQHRMLASSEAGIPPHTSSERVQKAVRAALIGHGWIIDQEESGATVAHLQDDKLYAKVRVSYDEKQAVVHYVDSKGFNYEKMPNGEEHIHSHYLLWTRNITHDISEKLSATPN
jgi:hypothetical protein